MVLVTDVHYIAGFVARKVAKQIDCIEQLICAHSESDLLNIKNRGGLIKPCKDVANLCLLSERILRQNEFQLLKKNVLMFLNCKIKYATPIKIFNSTRWNHMS